MSGSPKRPCVRFREAHQNRQTKELLVHFRRYQFVCSSKTSDFMTGDACHYCTQRIVVVQLPYFPRQCHEFFQGSRSVFRFISQQYHTRNKQCKMIEMFHHGSDIVGPARLPLIFSRERHMSDKVPRPDGRKHGPVNAGDFEGGLFDRSLHELVPLQLAQTNMRLEEDDSAFDSVFRSSSTVEVSRPFYFYRSVCWCCQNTPSPRLHPGSWWNGNVTSWAWGKVTRIVGGPLTQHLKVPKHLGDLGEMDHFALLKLHELVDDGNDRKHQQSFDKLLEVYARLLFVLIKRQFCQCISEGLRVVNFRSIIGGFSWTEHRLHIVRVWGFGDDRGRRPRRPWDLEAAEVRRFAFFVGRLNDSWPAGATACAALDRTGAATVWWERTTVAINAKDDKGALDLLVLAGRLASEAPSADRVTDREAMSRRASTRKLVEPIMVSLTSVRSHNPVQHGQQAEFRTLWGCTRYLRNRNVGEITADLLMKLRVDLTRVLLHVALGSKQHTRQSTVCHRCCTYSKLDKILRPPADTLYPSRRKAILSSGCYFINVEDEEPSSVASLDSGDKSEEDCRPDCLAVGFRSGDAKGLELCLSRVREDATAALESSDRYLVDRLSMTIGGRAAPVLDMVQAVGDASGDARLAPGTIHSTRRCPMFSRPQPPQPTSRSLAVGLQQVATAHCSGRHFLDPAGVQRTTSVRHCIACRTLQMSILFLNGRCRNWAAVTMNLGARIRRSEAWCCSVTWALLVLYYCWALPFELLVGMILFSSNIHEKGSAISVTRLSDEHL
ncbi:hypothetical protein KCU88_g217, partial [Aureobasidium melanogenum]